MKTGFASSPTVLAHWMTLIEVKRIVGAMRAGDVVIYHQGVLSRDRTQPGTGERANFFLDCGTPRYDVTKRGRIETEIKLGKGLGHLVQRRLSPGRYDYLFVKGAGS